MKYSSGDYAKALSEFLVRGDSKKDGEKIAQNFLTLVVKNGDEKKLPEILALAESIAAKKTGKKTVRIETARRLSEKNRQKITKAFGKDDKLEEKINPDLIAGMKITIDGELQYDASISNKIKSIF